MKTLAIALAFSLVLLADDAPQKVTGEVVDAHCYLSRGAHGEEHAGCANACLSRDVPAALVTADGTIYLLLNEKPVSLKEKIAGKAGKTMTATGKVVERNGLKAIQVATIE